MHVHHVVTHREELLPGGKCLSEKVGPIVISGDEGATNHVILDQLTHVEVAPVDMFHLSMMLGIVGYIYSRAVVHMQVRRVRLIVAQFGGQIAEIDGFFACLGGSHDLGFARRQSDALLFLRSPGDGSLVEDEDPPGRRVPRSITVPDGC